MVWRILRPFSFHSFAFTFFPGYSQNFSFILVNIVFHSFYLEQIEVLLIYKDRFFFFFQLREVFFYNIFNCCLHLIILINFKQMSPDRALSALTYFHLFFFSLQRASKSTLYNPRVTIFLFPIYCLFMLLLIFVFLEFVFSCSITFQIKCVQLFSSVPFTDSLKSMSFHLQIFVYHLLYYYFPKPLYRKINDSSNLENSELKS